MVFRNAGFSHPIFVFFLFLFIAGCTEVKLNVADNPLEPDLTIRSVTFRTIRSAQKESPHSRIIFPPFVEREFVLIIENKGSGDWTGDLIIGYSRSETEFRNGEMSGYQQVVLENNRLPFASRRQVVFSLKLKRGVRHIRSMVNPPVPAFLQKERKRTSEMFYGNNTFEVKL